MFVAELICKAALLSGVFVPIPTWENPKNGIENNIENNKAILKQLEKSNDQALKLNETLKDLIKLQTHFFKNEFSIKVITENTRLSLRSELAKIYENQIS